ncbi:MAG: glycerol-3-phosphate acyltransferase [Actinomycetales bacterium]|nr:glycerol-3-phosphate acyltransferase [Actinomycetales bacterium]
MNAALAITAVVVGYLVGSIQPARLIWAHLRPGTAPEPLRTPTRDGQAEIVSHTVGASNVMAAFGARWGMTTMALDILKAFIPVLAFRLAFPDQPAFLLCGVAVLVGHNWPVWYRFAGGAGNSSIMGMLLAIDPLALVVTHAVGMAIGMAFPIVAFLAGVALTIPWFAWRAGVGSPEMWFAVVITTLYVLPQLPAAVQLHRLRKAGHVLDVGHVMGMMRHSARTGRPGAEKS